MKIEHYEGVKIAEGQSLKVLDALSIEKPLQILLNDETFSVTMRTPGDDHDLIRGLLFSEDIVKKHAFKQLLFENKKNSDDITDYINIIGDTKYFKEGFLNSRSLLSVTSCGICGKKELDELKPNHTPVENKSLLSSELIYTLFKQMNEQQESFLLSGGTHAAASFTIDGQLLSVKEDIGRHNAVDKVIGNLINEEQIQDVKLLLVSGRVSYEIICKTFKAGIPFLAAVSAPTSLAVDMAKELGICLIGFCRDERLTVYSNSQRVI